MYHPRYRLALLALAALVGALPRTAHALDLVDGDRIVLMGCGLIEQEQRTGYWETELVRSFPERNIQFRNLGWTGDTVYGEARAGFGSPAEGFKHLQEEVFAAKPTVILVAYGTNESFDGPAGLARFRGGLERLLQVLSQTKARIILLAPLRHEDLGRPLPEPTAANKNLQLYTGVLVKVAAERGHELVDLNALLAADQKSAPQEHLTDDTMHLTAYGYWRTAHLLARALGAPEEHHSSLDDLGFTLHVEGMRRTRFLGENRGRLPLRFEVADAFLPQALPPEKRHVDGQPREQRKLTLKGLSSRNNTLKIDGERIITATAAQWAAGVSIQRGPEFKQAEQLRQAIIAKNRLYFHRWRPQNETYLFGFRKHEQGQNAKEVAEFEPLVSRLEAEIAHLREPKSHVYELLPEDGTKK